MPDLTPRQIVQELDRYIVGQDAAKRAVAVAANGHAALVPHCQDRRGSHSRHLIISHVFAEGLPGRNLRTVTAKDW